MLRKAEALGSQQVVNEMRLHYNSFGKLRQIAFEVSIKLLITIKALLFNME